MLRYRSFELYGHLPSGIEAPRRPDLYGALRWAPMHQASKTNLETLLRRRMRAAPSKRGVLAARRIGWLYSDGPDNSF